MPQRRMPEWLRHSPTPRVRSFAILAGIESISRGILISTFPLVMYQALGDAELVSEVYFSVGILSLITGLLVPWLARRIPRRWLYTAGGMMTILGSSLAATGTPLLVGLGLGFNTASVVVMFVCFNAYVMDHIKRTALGSLETQRLFYSGFAWTFGPLAGVTLMEWWQPAPFLISVLCTVVLMGTFWFFRISDGRQISGAKAPSPNPLVYLPRFFSQPRLISGWLFAVIRSIGWWAYIVYLPIFAVQNGFDQKLGGMLLSMSNGILFLTPFMLRWMNAHSVKQAVRVGFFMSAFGFIAASVFSSLPIAVILLLATASFFLILLDVSAGLPFLMAVKPGERTEMSAVYATYRDVSGIVTPGIGRLVLMVAPLPVIFAVTGVFLGAAFLIAGKLHPRLGKPRLQGENQETNSASPASGPASPSTG